MKSESQILPLSPIKVQLPAKKFMKPPCVAIASQFSKPRKITNKWWKNPPTQAGCAQNAAMKRISSVESFTGTVKHNHRFNKEIARIRHEKPDVEEESMVDFAHAQISKSSIGKSVSMSMLQNQSDHLSEAIFRSQLRNYS
tara:strand:- start:55 stop:477 length:423 start_codon:yes stop_codon:yes gene_type:complete